MEGFIPTRGSLTKKSAADNYVSVNYEARKKKLKLSDSSDNEKSQKKLLNSKTKQDEIADLKNQQEKEMKKARYDIIKFGMSGFEKVKARKAKVELAISLGAVPPKNRKVNYKILKTRLKQKEDKKEEHISGFDNSMRKHKPKKIHKKDSGILGVYGKVSKDTSSKRKRN